MHIYSTRRDLRGNVSPDDSSWEVVLGDEVLAEGDASNQLDAVHAVSNVLSDAGENLRGVRGDNLTSDVVDAIAALTRQVSAAVDAANTPLVVEGDFAAVETVTIPGSTVAVALHIDTADRGWLNIRRAVESLGLNVNAQLRALRDAKWATVAQWATVGADGRTRQASFLSMESVPMWLAGIDASKVKEPARSNLLAYQAEAARALYEHMILRRIAPQAPVLDTATASALMDAMSALQLRVNTQLDAVRAEVSSSLDAARAQLLAAVPSLRTTTTPALPAPITIDAEELEAVAAGPAQQITSDGLSLLERTPWKTTGGERMYTARQWLSHIGRDSGRRVNLSLGQIAATVGDDMKVSPIVKHSRNLWIAEVWAEAVTRYDAKQQLKEAS